MSKKLDKKISKYEKVYMDIKSQIIHGELKPGERLPSEIELSSNYKVSYLTTRQAIGKLVDEKYLQRLKGIGTFVCKSSIDSLFVRFYRDYYDKDVLPTSKILSKKEVDLPTKIKNTLKPGKKNGAGIYLTRLRLIKNIPILFEEIWLDYEKFNKILFIPNDTLGDLLYPAYYNFCNQIVVSANETLKIENSNSKVEKMLNLKKNSSVISIERIALGYADAPLEYRITKGIASKFQYKIKIN